MIRPEKHEGSESVVENATDGDALLLGYRLGYLNHQVKAFSVVEYPVFVHERNTGECELLIEQTWLDEQDEGTAEKAKLIDGIPLDLEHKHIHYIKERT